MASAFGHAASAYGISRLFGVKESIPLSLIIIGIVLSIFPDVDVLAFKFGIAYDHPFGHRGFTHSIFFAALISLVISFFYRKSSLPFLMIFFYLFICTISHACLDACTTGGKGVAFFAPFDNSRYFFPEMFRVIKVSPLGIKNFFSKWGMQVIYSELFWIGVPTLLIYTITKYWKRSNTQ